MGKGFRKQLLTFWPRTSSNNLKRSEHRKYRADRGKQVPMAANEMTIAWSGNGTEDPVGGSTPLGVTRRTLAASDERALIERAQGGDREAFEELVRIYDRDVLRIALNILHATEDAR